MSKVTELKQRVCLIKTDGVLGPAPVGEKYEVKVAADLPRSHAIARAIALLKRDHPDENQTCWSIDGEAAA